MHNPTLISGRGFKVRLFLCLCFVAPVTAGSPLFIAERSDPSAVDGGLSRGVAFGDADGDGDPDLLVANTINYPEFLYRNDGRRFVQVMQTAPSLAGGYTEGVNWIDYDNDGDLDVFAVRTKGPNALYRNDGAWVFVTIDADSLTMGGSTSSMACWADIDRDGWLDVFIVNRNGEPDALFRNVKGNRFEHVESELVGRAGGDGRACVAADFDGDDQVDLYVGNFIDRSTQPATRQRNWLFLGDGGFGFREVVEDPAVQSRALTYGLSAADVENDGDADLLVTNIGLGEQNMLYLNDGTGRFIPSSSGLVTANSTPSKGHTWGDFDLDGDLDLAIANGTEGTEHIQNELFMNDGQGYFRAVAGEPFVSDSEVSAGIAWADIDMDGDLDLYVANWGSGDEDNVLYRNQADGMWLILALEGRQSNRMAVGTRVAVNYRLDGEWRSQTRWLSASTGYASQNEPVLHFGFESDPDALEIVVDWPSGQRDVKRQAQVNKRLHLIEGFAGETQDG